MAGSEGRRTWGISALGCEHRIIRRRCRQVNAGRKCGALQVSVHSASVWLVRCTARERWQGYSLVSERNTANDQPDGRRSEEHTSELQSLLRTSYAVFCLT